MVFFLSLLLFGILVIGPQVVLSLNITFELSEVQQCAPVSITLDGNITAHTMSQAVLTIVPLDSIPASIPISNAASNISSASVTFVPFAAGTVFLASLDDANGENFAKVSNIIKVVPSQTGNATCLSKSDHTVTARTFNVDNSTFSQCENFTVKYNHTVVSRAPSVRAFSPGGASRLLNLTNDDNSTGTATYLLTFRRTSEVVLVFDDGLGHKESSTLMTVNGELSSPGDCLSEGDFNGSPTEPNQPNSRISMSVVIGASIGGGVVVLIAFCMLLFILRERRRRRQADIEFGTVQLEKETPSLAQEKQSSTLPSPIANDQGFVVDPPYTHQSRDSMASWSHPPSNDQRSEGHKDCDDDVSLNSLDIEGMLNMAAVQSNRSSTTRSRSSTQTVEPIPFGPTYPGSPHLNNKRPRQHIRVSSDVPFGPESMASAFSLSSVVDPFADDVIKRQDKFGLHSRHNSMNSAGSLVLPPSQPLRGLPTSPRDAPPAPRERRVNVKLGVVLEDGPESASETPWQ